LRVLGDALALASRSGEQFDESTLLRLRGELLLQMPGEDVCSSIHAKEAEACFQKAIALARDRGARSIELQVALSLSRLWHRQGNNGAARQMLAEIHGSFTEGFDTVDWRHASELLEAWS